MAKSILQFLKLGAVFSLALISCGIHNANGSAAGEFLQPDHQRYSKPRRRLEPTANIAEIINEELSKGVKHPRFKLTAFNTIFQPSGMKRSFIRNSAYTSEPFEVDVVLTDPSVTDATSFSVSGGESKQANSTTKFLVADPQTVDESASTDFAILAVDEESGTVKGIVQKGDQLVKWVQDPGSAAVVSEASFTPPQDWTCTVNEEVGDEETRRRLEGMHTHDHRHHDHEGSQEPTHSHNHFNLGNIENFAAQLGIEKVNLQSHRRLYATDTFPNEYSYQVDLYIEVDTAMVTAHDPSDSVNMPNTIAYVNALITGKFLMLPLRHLLISCLSNYSNCCQPLPQQQSPLFTKEKWILIVSCFGKLTC